MANGPWTGVDIRGVTSNVGLTCIAESASMPFPAETSDAGYKLRSDHLESGCGIAFLLGGMRLIIVDKAICDATRPFAQMLVYAHTSAPRYDSSYLKIPAPLAHRTSH